MKIKIERSQKSKTSKKKKERIASMGKHRKMVLALWFLLFCSVSFGIYKNFTAVDQHTTHEKVVVKEKVMNTSGVENFTMDFAKEYFSWRNEKVAIEKRMGRLEQYLSEEALTLSQDMVRIDIPTSSEVQSLKILDVERQSNEFVVSFLANQNITKAKKTQQISLAYRVTIFEDEIGNHVVTSLPTMIEKPGKAIYKEKSSVENSEIDVKTTEEINGFLETFFKLYPTASEKELEYYAQNNVIRPINNNLKFVELMNPVYIQNGEDFQVRVNVKYLDNLSKVTSCFQYKLGLQKNENWTIIDSD